MFLALLELVRLQAVLLRQDNNFSEIYIKKHASFESLLNQGTDTGNGRLALITLPLTHVCACCFGFEPSRKFAEL